MGDDGDWCADFSELGLAGRQSKLIEHLLKVAQARYREFLDIIRQQFGVIVAFHINKSDAEIFDVTQRMRERLKILKSREVGIVSDSKYLVRDMLSSAVQMKMGKLSNHQFPAF